MSTFLSKTLTGLARERGLGYEKLADLTDLSPVFIWRVMDGQKGASYLTIHKLASALAQVEPVLEAVNPTVGETFILFHLLHAAVKDAVAKSNQSRPEIQSL